MIMFMKVTSAELYAAVELRNLPTGDYRGVGGGYEVNVVINGSQYRMQTSDGIRTMRADCTVKVRQDGVTVEYD